MHEARLFLPFPSPIASAIAGALSPEANVSEVPRTSATIATVGDEVRVEVRADDLPSLRAAINSYLRWADAAERAARLV